jgi:hypothetical protein
MSRNDARSDKQTPAGGQKGTTDRGTTPAMPAGGTNAPRPGAGKQGR